MSRARSTSTKATPAKKSTRPTGRPGVYVATPKSDIYVALLGVSLTAMIVATLLLTLLLQRYDFATKVG